VVNLTAFINTQLQLGVWETASVKNRFNGFSREPFSCEQTVETVLFLSGVTHTRLKPGVNEKFSNIKNASAFYFFFCAKLLWQCHWKRVKNEIGLT